MGWPMNTNPCPMLNLLCSFTVENFEDKDIRAFMSSTAAFSQML
jgi:hypothetical protein